MGVNHGGADVGVAKSLLDRMDGIASFQQMGGEGVAQRVRPDWLGAACPEPCHPDSLLDHRFMHNNGVCPEWR